MKTASPKRKRRIEIAPKSKKSNSSKRNETEGINTEPTDIRELCFTSLDDNDDDLSLRNLKDGIPTFYSINATPPPLHKKSDIFRNSSGRLPGYSSKACISLERLPSLKSALPNLPSPYENQSPLSSISSNSFSGIEEEHLNSSSLFNTSISSGGKNLFKDEADMTQPVTGFDSPSNRISSNFNKLVNSNRKSISSRCSSFSSFASVANNQDDTGTPRKRSYSITNPTDQQGNQNQYKITKPTIFSSQSSVQDYFHACESPSIGDLSDIHEIELSTPNARSGIDCQDTEGNYDDISFDTPCSISKKLNDDLNKVNCRSGSFSESSGSFFERSTSASRISRSIFQDDDDEPIDDIASSTAAANNNNTSFEINHTVSTPTNTVFRPLPDQSAFDTVPRRNHHIPTPPTPQRNTSFSHTPPRSHLALLPSSATRIFNDVHATRILYDASSTSHITLGSGVSSATSPIHSEASNISLHTDFEEFSLMGSGNFAEVFCVRERSSGKDYAVKKSKAPFKGRSDREFVLKEVNIMKRVCQLHSPYVLQLVRAWQEDGYLHVQLELAERGTLLGLMNTLSASGQSFPEDTIWRVLHDVGSGLSHIHSCGVIHLDIKPANILISIDGTLMIGDFGNAIFAAEVSQQSDGIEGDIRYFAPELLLYPCVVTSAADVFSFGLTLLELWNFVPGYDGLPGQGVEWQDVRNGRHKFREGISNQLAETITAMLRHSQDDRPSVDILLKGENVVRVSRLAADVIILLASLQTHVLTRPNRSASLIAMLDNAALTGTADELERAITPTNSVFNWPISIPIPISAHSLSHSHSLNAAAVVTSSPTPAVERGGVGGIAAGAGGGASRLHQYPYPSSTTFPITTSSSSSNHRGTMAGNETPFSPFVNNNRRQDFRTTPTPNSECRRHPFSRTAPLSFDSQSVSATPFLLRQAADVDRSPRQLMDAEVAAYQNTQRDNININNNDQTGITDMTNSSSDSNNSIHQFDLETMMIQRQSIQSQARHQHHPKEDFRLFPSSSSSSSISSLPTSYAKDIISQSEPMMVDDPQVDPQVGTELEVEEDPLASNHPKINVINNNNSSSSNNKLTGKNSLVGKSKHKKLK